MFTNWIQQNIDEYNQLLLKNHEKFMEYTLKGKIHYLNSLKVRFENLNSEQRLAFIIHETFCKKNHIYDCDWCYHDDSDWNSKTKKKYLNKAKKILSIMDDDKKIIAIIEQFKD